METASQVLLIIVSSVLSIFLLIGIVALVKLVQVLNHLKHITEKAGQIADDAEATARIFRNTAAPAALTQIIANLVHSFKRGKDKK